MTPGQIAKEWILAEKFKTKVKRLEEASGNGLYSVSFSTAYILSVMENREEFEAYQKWERSTTSSPVEPK